MAFGADVEARAGGVDEETLELVLANRSFLYAMLARGFTAEIDATFVQAFASDHAREEMGLMEAAETASIAALHDELATWLLREGSLDDARRKYVRMFVGPGTLRADPWETVQLSGRRSLFQPDVLDVRAAYRAAGFEPVRVRAVPDDFIGTELDFMAKMAVRAQAEHAQGERAQSERAQGGDWRQTLRWSHAFLADHLARWIGLLAASIEDGYGRTFYAGFARLAAFVVQRDMQVVAELLADC